MTTGQHVQAVRAGEKSSKNLKILMNSMGSGKNPGGEITALYTTYLGMLKYAKSIAETRRLLKAMRRELEFILSNLMEGTYSVANLLVNELIDIYELPGTREVVPPETIVIAALASFDLQRDKVLAGLHLNTDIEILYGNAHRVGVLSHGAVSRDVAHFAPTLISYIIDYRVGSREKYFKQAVAALDFRTTNCCILVHGQVQEWNTPFNLVGIPRFADKIRFPPFHFWCRTATVLVHEKDVDDEVTRRMRAKAQTYIPHS